MQSWPGLHLLQSTSQNETKILNAIMRYFHISYLVGLRLKVLILMAPPYNSYLIFNEIKIIVPHGPTIYFKFNEIKSIVPHGPPKLAPTGHNPAIYFYGLTASRGDKTER